jgi:ureidoacrylate peracid hydrolase
MSSALLHDQAITGLLVVDPYNDFISEGGKFWGRLREVAEKVGCVPNMLRVLEAARRAGLRVFYAPHHRWRQGDYDTWKYWAPTQRSAAKSRAFEDGTWGGTFRDEFKPLPGEIVAQEHWASSGFANTDLDLQLKKHGIHKVIVIGLIAVTCIDSTVRFAAELGYEVTLVKDAIASRTWEEMTATLEQSAPNYAEAIVTTEELLQQLSAQTRA